MKTPTEYSRDYRARNPDKVRAYAKAWRLANPEKVKKSYDKNKEKYYANTVAWKKANPDKMRLIERRRNLKKKYGMTLEDYDTLLAKQNYACAICLKSHREERLPLAVDHDHSSGRVRGLLCNDCNRNLIAQRDSPEIFLRAAEYIRSKVG